MRINRAFLFLLILLLTSFPAAAMVEPGREGNLVEFVPPVPGERICFSRTYSAEHLAKHPKQTVAKIDFDLTYFRHEPDVHNEDGQRNYYYRLSVRFRDRPGQTFKAVGDCHPGDGSIFCSVECDGGGVRVRWRKRPGSILIDFDSGYGIRLSACGGDDEDIDKERAEDEDETEREGAVLVPGEDDKSFLLTRMKHTDCADYEKW